MPTNTLISSNVVRLAEDVEDKIYNYRPTDTPLVSAIDRVKVTNTLHEWTADTYRAPNGDNAAIEGADADFSPQQQPGQYFNRTQILQDTMSISNTAETVHKYGRKSEIARLKAKKMIELRRDMEAAAIGNATVINGNAALAGKMRGLYGFIATNNALGAGGVAPDPQNNTAPTTGTTRPLTEEDFKAVLLAVYQHGGDASVAMVSPQHKQKCSTFTGNVERTNEVANKSAGQIQLNTAYTFYGHDFGVTKIVPNRVMGAGGIGLVNTAYIVDYDKLALGQLRPFESEELSTTGDAKNWQIRTEVTLIVRQESTLGAIRDLTASGS